MTRTGFAVAAVASLLSIRSAVSAREFRMTPTAALSALRAERSRIVAIRVTHVDDLTQTQTPLTPQRLSASPGAFHHDSHDAATIDEALHLLERSLPEATTQDFEVRWEISFVDASGTALLSVYHHSREGYGYVGPSRVRFAHDGLLPFLHARFGAHEKTLDRL